MKQQYSSLKRIARAATSSKWNRFKQENKNRRAFIGLALLLTLMILPLTSISSQAQGPLYDWYQIDTHVHSVVSAEAQVDAGILSQAEVFGYDGLMVTDHNNASEFHINNLTANHMEFLDNGARWDIGSYGQLSSSTNELSTVEVAQGSQSLFLSSSSNSNDLGETFRWSKRGPNFRAGDITLDVSIFPTQIDANSGAYVSVSIGGDPTVEIDHPGYTTDPDPQTQGDEVISPGKSIVLVWQIGNPRLPSSNPNQQVIVNDLGSFNLNQWNNYTIDVTDVLDTIAAVDRPLDYNALTHIKIATAATNGTASAYFDAYLLTAPGQSPAVEYVNRTEFIDDFDSSTFRLQPSHEMGQRRHTNRFNFGITDPSEFFSTTFGTDEIQQTHQSGFPVKLNHPDVTISPQEVLSNNAYDADALEVRRDEWIDVWDDLLNGGLFIVGDWSSDAHRGVTNGKPATYLYAQDDTFESWMQSYFEGRGYMARNHFDGQVIWNLDANDSQTPYPGRYIVYLSDEQTSADVHLLVTDGLREDYTITWIRNDQVIHTETIPDNQDDYEETRSVTLPADWNYVRAEVRRHTGSSRALTQPIVFVRVPDLPSDIQYSIHSITTPNERNYNTRFTKGIVETTWSDSSEVLHMGLVNPLDALVEIHINSDDEPEEIEAEGNVYQTVNSQSAFDALTDTGWYYDSNNDMIYLKVRQAYDREDVLIEFDNSGDTTPPTVPTNLSADAIHLGRIDLDWSSSTDDLIVENYNIFRDDLPAPSLLAMVDSQTLAYTDTEVLPGTTYNYTVSAIDVAGNESAQSATVSATTPGSATFTEVAVADAYVNSSRANNNFGNSTILRTDASPTINSYVQFDVDDLPGTIEEARLRIYTNSGSPVGVDIHSVSDNSWDETSITFNNAPSLGSIIASSGPYSSQSWIEIDVTSGVQENQLVTLGISTTSNTNHSLGSLNSSNDPELIIVMGP